MKKSLNTFVKKIMVSVAHVSPRSKHKWLFGMESAFYDNSKYAFLYLNIYHKEIDAIWITKNKDTRDYIRSLGYKSYLRWEALGVWHGLTAGVYLFSYSLYNVHFLLKGKALIVNMWHGLPLKCIEFNSDLVINIIKKTTTEEYLYNKNFDYLMSPSKKFNNVFLDSFLSNEDSLIECFYPRCEYLINLDFQKKVIIDAEMNELIIEAKSYAKSYIYLPTWRDTAIDFFKTGDFNLELLNKKLIVKNEIFLIKLHSETNPKIINRFSGFSNIKVINANITDIYPFLLHSDCLITDYSSIYFDYLLLEKPIILFPFDIDDYESKSRELAFDYDEMMIGDRVNSFAELLLAIEDKSYEKCVPALIEHKNSIWSNNKFEIFVDIIWEKYLAKGTLLKI